MFFFDEGIAKQRKDKQDNQLNYSFIKDKFEIIH